MHEQLLFKVAMYALSMDENTCKPKHRGSLIQNRLAATAAASFSGSRQPLGLLRRRGHSSPSSRESPIARNGAPWITTNYFAGGSSSNPALAAQASTGDKIWPWKWPLGPTPSQGHPNPPPRRNTLLPCLESLPLWQGVTLPLTGVASSTLGCDRQVVTQQGQQELTVRALQH